MVSPGPGLQRHSFSIANREMNGIFSTTIHLRQQGSVKFSCSNKHPQDFRGSNKKGPLLSHAISSSQSSGSLVSHSETPADRAATSGAFLSAAAEEKRAWSLVHWLLKLLPRGHSFYIWYSTLLTKACYVINSTLSGWTNPVLPCAQENQTYLMGDTIDYHIIQPVLDATLGLALCCYGA